MKKKSLDGINLVVAAVVVAAAAGANADMLDIVVNINGVNITITEEMFKKALPQNMSAVSFDDTNASLAQQVCPAGYYCPFNTPEPVACPESTYQPNTGQTQLSDCRNCTEGSYCPSPAAIAAKDCPVGNRCPFKLMTSPEICPLGYYQSSTKQAICQICPAGSKCNATGLSAPIPCSAGKYQPQEGQTTCIVCPPGQICTSDTTVNPTNCTAGTYAPNEGNALLDHCLSCTAGHYCPDASVTPTACPKGTYVDGVGAKNIDQCSACPAGKWCDVGTVNPIDCPQGKIRNTTGASSADMCLQCPAGQWCTTTTATLCAPGTYRETEGAYNAEMCLVCPPGKWCSTTTATDCAIGTIRATSGASSANMCLACPAGQWCTTTTATQCPAGTFRVLEGASAATDCQNCVLGTFETSTTRTSACPVCDANFYCPTTLIKNQCPENTVSEAGSTSQLGCWCKAGFVCFYTKKIQAVVTLNSTVDAFTQNVDNIQQNFLAAIAAAAGVDPTKVTIVSVSKHGGGGRRLLGHEGVEIVALVEGAHTLSNIETHVAQRGLHIHSHSWRESHTVRSHYL